MKFWALILLCARAFTQPLSPAAWKEDLDFLARELPARHKNLFYTRLAISSRATSSESLKEFQPGPNRKSVSP